MHQFRKGPSLCSGLSITNFLLSFLTLAFSCLVVLNKSTVLNYHLNELVFGATVYPFLGVQLVSLVNYARS